MRVARILIYDGDEREIRDMLTRSLSEGAHEQRGGSIITVMALPDSFLAVIDAIADRLVSNKIAGRLAGSNASPLTPPYAQQAQQQGQLAKAAQHTGLAQDLRARDAIIEEMKRLESMKPPPSK